MDSLLLPYLSQFVVILCRMGGLFFSAPFFSGSGLFLKGRVIFALVFTLLLYPVLTVPPVYLLGGLSSFVAACFLEMAVGTLIGLVLNFVFAGIQMGGELMGFEIGYSIIQTMDPTTMVETNILAVFFNLIALILLMVTNAHHLVILLLVRSYDLVPVGGLTFTPEGVNLLIRQSTEVFTLGIRLAAPVLIVLISIDVVIGLMGRAAPSLNILIVGFPLKILVGLFVVGFTLFFFPGFFDAAMRNAVRSTERILQAMRGVSIF